MEPDIVFKIRLMPSQRKIRVERDTILSDVLTDGGIIHSFDCGGKGTCGRCLVQVDGKVSGPSKAELKHLDKIQLDEGWRLACQVKINGDINVFIPGVTENIEGIWESGDPDLIFLSDNPVILKRECKFEKPALTDSRSDLKRILDGLKSDGDLSADFITAGRLTEDIREFDWEASCYLRGNELIGIGSKNKIPAGIAVDLGSTKIAAYLMDLGSGRVLAKRGVLNPQIAYGADVVTRLQRAIAKKESKKRLSNLVREALNSLITRLTEDVGLTYENILELAIVGNSAMIHLFLDLPVKQLAFPPFVTSFCGETSIKARDLKIKAAAGAYIYFPPSIGGFVGSDNISMIIGSDMDRPGPWRLGLDIGTNTEVVLAKGGDDNHLFIASAPSGPAFEGAHLSSGMRAFSGAVTKVEVDNDIVSAETIDGEKPQGICGSGVIDAVSELYRNRIINRQGHLDRKRANVIPFGNSLAYLLISKDKTAGLRDIVITQSDISQIQLAKAAISAAIMKLIQLSGIEKSDIREIILAGSFGNHIDIEGAKNIGLIPSVESALYSQVGNAAGRGAVLMLNDKNSRRRAEEVPERARYVELSGESDFNSLFAKNLPFPKV